MRKGYIIARCRVARSNVARIFCSKNKPTTMQPNARASAARACKDGKHSYVMFSAARRVPQITVLRRVFVTMAQQTARANKKRTERAKSNKKPFYTLSAHIIDKQSSQYKRETCVSCVYCEPFSGIWASAYPHPVFKGLLLRCRFSIFLYINFCDFFIFHFFIQYNSCNLQILPIYLPYNRANVFLRTISHPR